MQIYPTEIGCKYVNQPEQAQNNERSFVNTDMKVQTTHNGILWPAE
jgi:hypothetical protein